MSTDNFADLLEARLACVAADRELSKLSPTDPARPAVEAALKQGQERYARAVQAHEEKARRERDG
jgi:hypothetical protein